MSRPANALLEALAQAKAHGTKGRQLLQLPIDVIEEDPENARKHFDPAALQELADSIRAQGLVQPLVVSAAPDGRWRLESGARRLRACLLAGLTTVPAVTAGDAGDAASRKLVENIQREDLSAVEVGNALRALIDTTGAKAKDVGKRLGKSETWVSRRLGVLKLPEALQTLCVDGIVRDPESLFRLAKLTPEQQAAAVVSLKAGVPLVDLLASAQPTPPGGTAVPEAQPAPQRTASPKTASADIDDQAKQRIERLGTWLRVDSLKLKTRGERYVITIELDASQLERLDELDDA